ncbi:hypothetical protein ScPMuIL_018242 [Solemya velum]
MSASVSRHCYWQTPTSRRPRAILRRDHPDQPSATSYSAPRSPRPAVGHELYCAEITPTSRRPRVILRRDHLDQPSATSYTAPTSPRPAVGHELYCAEIDCKQHYTNGNQVDYSKEVLLRCCFVINRRSAKGIRKKNVIHSFLQTGLQE